MYAWTLPTSIHVMGVDWDIRTDFRDVIDVLNNFSNADFDADERWLYALYNLIIDFDNLPSEYYGLAAVELKSFIDMGVPQDEKKNDPKLMDWEHDASLIIPAVNRVIGHEVRAEKYMHWWTFLSSYMEIGECSFTHILNMRMKKAKGKKLESWEKEYIRENKTLVELKAKKTAEELEEERLLEELFG